MDGISECHAQRDSGACLGCRAPLETQPRCREKVWTRIWRRREREGCEVNELEQKEAAGRAGKWSALQWKEWLLALHEGSLLLASAGLRNLPGVTEPALGPWAHLSLPLGGQGGGTGMDGVWQRMRCWCLH